MFVLLVKYTLFTQIRQIEINETLQYMLNIEYYLHCEIQNFLKFEFWVIQNLHKTIQPPSE